MIPGYDYEQEEPCEWCGRLHCHNGPFLCEKLAQEAREAARAARAEQTEHERRQVA